MHNFPMTLAVEVKEIAFVGHQIFPDLILQGGIYFGVWCIPTH